MPRIPRLSEAAHQRHHPSEEFVVTRRYSSLIELLIVDEANRLKDVALERRRDAFIVHLAPNHRLLYELAVNPPVSSTRWWQARCGAIAHQ